MTTVKDPLYTTLRVSSLSLSKTAIVYFLTRRLFPYWGSLLLSPSFLTSHVSALLPQLAAGEHRTPGTPSPAASPTRGGIPQRLRPRRRIASRASPTRQVKDTSRACPSPARRRIPISGHKIPILTTGYLPPPLRGYPGHGAGTLHLAVRSWSAGSPLPAAL